MKFCKPLLALAALCGSLLAAPAAQAATCSLASNGGRPLEARFGITSLTPASGNVSGAVLATRDIPISSLEYTCGANTLAELRMEMQTGAARTAVSDVYSTALPGLGYRIRWPSETWWPNALRCTATATGNCSVPAGAVRVEFVQTGRITSGTLAAGTLGTVTLLAPNEATNRVTALSVVLTTPIIVTTKSCAVTSDQTIWLGSHGVGDLQAAVGTTPVGFSLDFNCPQPSNVSITFNGTAPFGYSTSGLVQNNGTATGVGVQLMQANGLTGVRLGRANDLGSINGARSVDYRARLYRLRNDTLSAGTVDAFVVFTLDID